ncbi:16S rRNA (uracil(1498)-N(3))-methyltransferase [Terricaulis silvestris]|uniref:Ribosomal RNA small subunit methyltransferase E n=1 Tax=Terricaulis silvestris TaxID=2686094 RepID=A0A6I6MNK5_9CAUL|nr:16S rRNA (uracil(1498)-N(3))-methyltransferase [Terricaulis silvestris]QGZ94514.1 Ribosomal RNA small subunit methyltransferase E [Terricaulis silvestris]
MANPRLLIDQNLRPGAAIALDEAQARHVGTVLRLDEGDTLRVFNARDGEWSAKVSAKTKRGMIVAVDALLREARATPDLDLLFAPVKRHATDLIVEKATELGVRRIRPVITQRTIVETVRLDRLQSIAREAAEQTERFDAPEIMDPVSLAKIVDGWDAARPLIYADEAGDDANAAWGGESGRAAPIAQALLTWTAGVSPAIAGAGRRDAGGPSKLALLIGPEGGFTPEERRMLRALTFVTPVSLGPRILRAETAVIAALSVIQSTWGDWR